MAAGHEWKLIYAIRPKSFSTTTSVKQRLMQQNTQINKSYPECPRLHPQLKESVLCLMTLCHTASFKTSIDSNCEANDVL